MNNRWSTRIVVLHAVSAALVVGMVVAGFVMSDLAADSSLRLLLSRLHTVFGITLVGLTAVRLVSRWRGKSPAPLPLSTLHQRFVDLVHGLTYAVIFGLGVSGVVTAVRSTWPRYIRGELAAVPELEQVLSRQLHEALVYALLTLVTLHVGGVMVQELRGGEVLRRMFPMLGRKDRASERNP